jgi:hypothetical protein
LAFAPAFGWDLDLLADLRGSLARDVPLAFGFALLIGVSSGLVSLSLGTLRFSPAAPLGGTASGASVLLAERDEVQRAAEAHEAVDDATRPVVTQ